MKKMQIIPKILLIIGLVLSNFISFPTAVLAQETTSTNQIELRAFQQKAASKTYEGIASAPGGLGRYEVQYIIKVAYSLSYNVNTYQVSSITDPRIVVEYLYIKGGEGSQAYLSNISVNSSYTPGSDHGNFTWSFNIMGQAAGQHYFFKAINGSDTIWVP